MSDAVVTAPGRVNLIGEHTDYAGGLVLPVAIDLTTTLQWRPRAESVRVRSLAYEEVAELPADGSVPPAELTGWGRYVAAAVALLHIRGRQSAGIEAAVASTIPIGSGVSSSAAFTVALLLALCRAASFALEPLELARLAREAELLATGVPVGLMDPACIVLARRGHALLLDCTTEKYRHVPLPPDLGFVVIDSGVRHALEHSGYAERRQEVERGEPRRLRHIATENDRVRRVVAALESADVESLGTLFREGHESLRDDFEVSTPELDLLVDLAYAHGALAARMTGGGFGGAIVALSETSVAATLAGRVAAAYAKRTGREASTYLCESADHAAERANASARDTRHRAP
jgi:galactokinase